MAVGIKCDPGKIFYRKGLCVVPDVLYGIGFHWENRMDFVLSGEVRIMDDGTGIINRLPVEDYLASVISSEMNPEAPVEFLKAHSIISRSWVLGKITGCHIRGRSGEECSGNRMIRWEDSESHAGFDVCADDHCQRYQGVDAVSDAVREAVDSTRGIVIADSFGNIADARFSKCCGGQTELFSTCWQDDDYSYLRHIHDPYCDPERYSADERIGILSKVLKKYDLSGDYYSWREEISPEGVSARMNDLYGIDPGKITDIMPLARGASGRIRELLICGTNGEYTVGKELPIRRILSPSTLRSSWCEIEKCADGTFVAEGRGWGHGVGLCQTGAAFMAHEGKSYGEILSFYYPDTVLRKLYR